MSEWIIIYIIIAWVITIAMVFYWFGNLRGVKEARDYLEKELK